MTCKRCELLEAALDIQRKLTDRYFDMWREEARPKVGATAPNRNELEAAIRQAVDESDLAGLKRFVDRYMAPKVDISSNIRTEPSIAAQTDPVEPLFQCNTPDCQNFRPFGYSHCLECHLTRKKAQKRARRELEKTLKAAKAAGMQEVRPGAYQEWLEAWRKARGQ